MNFSIPRLLPQCMPHIGPSIAFPVHISPCNFLFTSYFLFPVLSYSSADVPAPFQLAMYGEDLRRAEEVRSESESYSKGFYTWDYIFLL